LTYAIILYSLIVEYIQFVIMLTELKEVLSLKLKCLCNKTTSPIGTVPKTKDVSLTLLLH
jgi:hypothetical protein